MSLTDKLKGDAAIRLHEVDGVVGLRFTRPNGGDHFLWEAGPAAGWSEAGDYKRLMDVNVEAGDGCWFVFYVSDCFDPPLYAVRGRSWEDAYEEFLEWKAVDLGLVITEAEMPDYDPEQVTHVDGVGAVDDEGVQGFEVHLDRVDIG